MRADFWTDRRVAAVAAMIGAIRYLPADPWWWPESLGHMSAGAIIWGLFGGFVGKSLPAHRYRYYSCIAASRQGWVPWKDLSRRDLVPRSYKG